MVAMFIVHAFLQGQLEICNLFMSYPSVEKNPRDNNGSTPLHASASKGHFKICEVLLENAIEKNPVDRKGWTPLYLAAQNGRKDVCQLIMEYIDTDNNEKTPDQLAKRNGLLEFVQLFIDSDGHNIYFWKNNYESSRK